MSSDIENQFSLASESIESRKNDESLMELGSGDFGCAHYRRRCKIRAPCCDKIFDCRHCHNEAKNSMEVDPLDRHELPRHEVKYGIDLHFSFLSQIQQNCINCGVCMGKYFCEKCKFFDDDVSKNQYHCDQCGICRTGGQENFFHCNKCRCCYSMLLKDSHRCVEGAMHHNCPVCFEYIFDSTKEITALGCGHTIHLDCLNEMVRHLRFTCPVCSKSVCDMSRVWERLDKEIASTPMPEIYQNKMVWILCNDCGTSSKVCFHIVAHKCLSCNSYNTRQTQGGPASCSSGISEMAR
ncbi:E3 ubiquitin-protein ligase RZFP34-like [Macadamia integrifolia]|uniref:E3 ubiquitin-protein ligase RZFP34-like n=1 Tax=Macadamia integrifolia TaxID=60698 RepID=UPI001C501324|nr:E3 ubiquitin-protein ligase RZFP34-like [Macadamia integrifolia]